MHTRTHKPALTSRCSHVPLTPIFFLPPSLPPSLLRRSQFAMLENRNDFLGKTVLDVGAGSGILSFFAARAGAKKVYAVEASGMAVKAAKLAKGNGLDGVVEVLHQKVEDVQLKERVDVLISEPLGIALVNERMLESYLHARDMLLKPGGKMYPDKSELFAAPFSDEPLYSEQYQKAAFWTQPSFYGVDLSALRDDALTFYFSQPVVGPVAPHTIAAAAVSKHFDFTSMSIDALQRFDIPLRFTMPAVQQIHGIALWFDCTFPGSQKQTVLSTSPVEPLTHWYQVRCLLQSPLAVGVGHSLSGNLRFEANESRGYNVHMTLVSAGTCSCACSARAWGTRGGLGPRARPPSLCLGPRARPPSLCLVTNTVAPRARLPASHRATLCTSGRLWRPILPAVSLPTLGLAFPTRLCEGRVLRLFI
jgi:SAM-dependent methyltransferase